MTTDDLAGILREHSERYVNLDTRRMHCKGCDEPLGYGQTAAHQAAVIAAAGWVCGEPEYRVWYEADSFGPDYSGLRTEEVLNGGYWFPIKNLNVAKLRERNPGARIEKRFAGASDWEPA